MSKQVFAVTTLLVVGSIASALAAPPVRVSHGIILAAGESANANIQGELENARRAIAARDMTLAAQALDRASAMAHDKPGMAAMVTHIADTRRMLMAGDTAGASRMLDSVIHDVAAMGSRG